MPIKTGNLQKGKVYVIHGEYLMVYYGSNGVDAKFIPLSTDSSPRYFRNEDGTISFTRKYMVDKGYITLPTKEQLLTLKDVL